MTTPTKTRLSAEDAAEYIGLSVSTMRSYRSAGKGPASYKLGRRVFYDIAELDRWIVDQRNNRRVAAFFDIGPHLASIGVRSGPQGAVGTERGVWFTHTEEEGVHIFVAANYQRAHAAKVKADAVQAALEPAGIQAVPVSDDIVQVTDRWAEAEELEVAK